MLLFRSPCIGSILGMTLINNSVVFVVVVVVADVAVCLQN